MTYVVISDAHHYKIAQIIETHKNHCQVELIPDRSKRKIKTEQQIYPLDSITDITAFYNHVTNLIPQIDSMLLGELIDDTTPVSLTDLVAIYFGDNANLIETTALLFNLANNNIDFYNYKNGSFRKNTPDEYENNLSLIRQQQLREEEYTYYLTGFIQHVTNNSIFVDEQIDALKLLHKPDKNNIIYKALQQAALQLKLNPIEICCKIGLISDVATYLTQCFMRDNFPRGLNHTLTNTSSVDISTLPQNLELNVFSIDDSTTTEIDDAFSLQITSDGYLVGIHIAAPALDHNYDQLVADNISTVYFPGNKITMLPVEIINHYSLLKHRELPVVSVYFNLDLEFNVLEYYSAIEIVRIADNLRIESLETMFNQDNLELDHNYPYETELKILYQFALKLEEKRGRPSMNSLVMDYNFSFNDSKVQIKPRIRGNPIDKLVSELMILANCSWGRLLTNAFIPAIYRVKQPNYPVKMTLNPDSHTGLNVDYYTWATSPLRRSVDYINQKQIISLVQNKKEYFSSINPTLLEVVDNFDSKYAKYLEFQNKMERYWSLQYIVQEQLYEFNATFIFKTSVQLEGVPIEIDLNNFTTPKPRGTQVKLKIYNINLSTLYFDFKLVEETATNN